MYFSLTASPPCRRLNYHITQNSNSGSTSQRGNIYLRLSFQMCFGNQRNKEVLKLLKVTQKPYQVLNFELKLTVKKYLICLNILWMILGEPFFPLQPQKCFENLINITQYFPLQLV